MKIALHSLLDSLRSQVLLLACLWITAAHAETAVVILLSDTGVAYNEVTAALRGELERGGIAAAEIQAGTDLVALSRLPAKLQIAVGAAALQVALDGEARAPILATLLPLATYEQILEQSGRRSGHPVSAVYLDQPLSRQFALIRLALPDARRVGVVLGPQSSGLSAALSKAADEHGLRLLTSRANTADGLFAALQKLMGDIDVLLAAPDPVIYNSTTIQSILLTTYRAQIPLIGFSPAYAKAGALLALYSSPAQLGAQTGEIARGVLAGRPLPQAQPPRDFAVSGNAHVARSLGLHLEDDAQLTDRLRQSERRP
jgi:putative ABC transport system substrate-binding protein